MTSRLFLSIAFGSCLFIAIGQSVVAQDPPNIVFLLADDMGYADLGCFGSPGDLRGAKGHIHEGGIRVPGIVRWLGKIKAGSENSEPINGTDWFATLSAAAGVEVPTDGKIIDGTDVLPALIDGNPVERERPMMWWLWHARGGFEVAMRDGDYKMIATMLPQTDPGAFADARQPADWTIMEFIKRAELGRFEMYNVAKDGSETTNLAEVEPRRFDLTKKKMIALHAEIRAEGRSTFLEGMKNRNEMALVRSRRSIFPRIKSPICH